MQTVNTMMTMPKTTTRLITAAGDPRSLSQIKENCMAFFISHLADCVESPHEKCKEQFHYPFLRSYGPLTKASIRLVAHLSPAWSAFPQTTPKALQVDFFSVGQLEPKPFEAM